MRRTEFWSAKVYRHVHAVVCINITLPLQTKPWIIMRTLGHHYSSLLEKLNSLFWQEINMMVSAVKKSWTKMGWEGITQHQDANAGFISGDINHPHSSVVTFQNCCSYVSMRNIQPCSLDLRWTRTLAAVAQLQRSLGVGGHPTPTVHDNNRLASVWKEYFAYML